MVCVFVPDCALPSGQVQYKSIPAVPNEQWVHPSFRKYEQVSNANHHDQLQSISPPIHSLLAQEITLDKVRPPNFTCPPIFNLIASNHTAGTHLHFNLLCQLPINTCNHDSQWHGLKGLHRVVQHMDPLIDKCHSAKLDRKFLEKDGSVTLNDLLITA